MKVRVYKNIDGSVAGIDMVSNSIVNINDARHPRGFDSLEYFLSDTEDERIPSDGDFIEQFYFDGDAKIENLKRDTNWELMIMPEALIKKRHIENLTNMEDEEISKNGGADLIKLLKINQEKLECPKWDTLKTFQKALENLDKEVESGEPDKPIVRGKLEQKILELIG